MPMHVWNSGSPSCSRGGAVLPQLRPCDALHTGTFASHTRPRHKSIFLGRLSIFSAKCVPEETSANVSFSGAVVGGGAAGRGHPMPTRRLCSHPTGATGADRGAATGRRAAGGGQELPRGRQLGGRGKVRGHSLARDPLVTCLSLIRPPYGRSGR